YDRLVECGSAESIPNLLSSCKASRQQDIISSTKRESRNVRLPRRHVHERSCMSACSILVYRDEFQDNPRLPRYPNYLNRGIRGIIQAVQASPERLAD